MLSYGNPSLIEKVGIVLSLLIHMPLVLMWTLLTSPFHHNNRHKSWKRVLGDKAFHHLTGRLSIRQLQWMMGTTRGVYEDWVKSNKLPLVIDELGEDARLLWIGERRTDRVILYFHGGGYSLPMPPCAADFWKYIQTQLQVRNKNTGLAILNFSLLPTVAFPTQLKQAALALQHLIEMGVDPQNIQISGDSAGAHLALQLISHILHPVPSVPRITLSSPIRGAYLMSPWVGLWLTEQTGSVISNGNSDIIGEGTITAWSNAIFDAVPISQRLFLEGIKSPDASFQKIATVVDRILITAGDAERIRDEIIVFADHICDYHENAQFVLQKHGVHNDPQFDFMTKESKLGELTPVIVDWFATGFD